MIALSLVTNDSDMSGAMRVVKKHHPDKRLGLFTPSSSLAARLKRFADFNKIITKSDLVAAQFPDPIINKKMEPIHLSQLHGRAGNLGRY